MIRMLAGFFVKNPTEYSNPKVRKIYGVLAGIVGIVLNVILAAGKFFAGILSGSISIVADAFNNLSDAGSSIISLMGFYLGEKKPDRDHPFGHGRMEYISALLVSVIILIMGFELAKSSVSKIIKPAAVETGSLTIVILIVAILVKLYMFLYNRMYGAKINSQAMKATAIDSISDVCATLVVLISVLVGKYTGVNIDGYAGLVVALFIFYAGIRSIKETMDPLLGQAPEPDFVQAIKDIVDRHEEIIGVHDLIVHDYGPGRRIISLHCEVSEDGNMVELHEVIDRCERVLMEELGCMATIHMDPITLNNERVDFLKTTILTEIHKFNSKISLHDFRVVDGPNQTNIIFDAVLPNDLKITEKELRNKLEDIIKELPGNCVGVITIDRQFSDW